MSEFTCKVAWHEGHFTRTLLVMSHRTWDGAVIDEDEYILNSHSFKIFAWENRFKFPAKLSMRKVRLFSIFGELSEKLGLFVSGNRFRFCDFFFPFFIAKRAFPFGDDYRRQAVADDVYGCTRHIHQLVDTQN